MTIESSRQVEQAVGIRRCGTNLDGRSLTVKQMEVETLAAEIQTGVQHCNGPPLDSSQSTSWSVSLGRPFFMAFLTMEVSGRYARAREGVRGHDWPANRFFLLCRSCPWFPADVQVDVPV